MSTKNAIIILVFSTVVAVMLLTRCGSRTPFKNDIVLDPFARPLSRPDRPDLDLVRQYNGQPMRQILNSLPPASNQAALESPSAARTLASSLPNAAFPFARDSAPVNQIALQQFTENIESGKLGDPSATDLWRYNLASAGLQKEVDSIPEKLRLQIELENDTENFPVKFAERPADMTGPFAVGNFDSSPALEVVSNGGSQMWNLGKEGNLMKKIGLEEMVAGSSLKPADYDNDGDLDLFITRRFGLPNSLLQNDGEGRFADVTSDVGLLAFSDTAVAEWTDLDQDGLKDLVIGNHDHPFEIYRQSSPGTFEASAWDFDLWYPGKVVDLEIADLNGDRYPDLYLSIEGRDDEILFSLPSTNTANWSFVEKGKETKLPLSDESLSICPVDFDNDGDFDLLTGTHSGESESIAYSSMKNDKRVHKSELRLFLNYGEGTLEEVTDGSGLEGVEDVRGLHVMDIDNDGFEDILVITGDLAFNRSFWNRSGVEFREISKGSQLSFLNSPEDVCSIDIDGDGALDVFLAEKNGPVKWVESEGSVNGYLNLELGNATAGTRFMVLARDTDWILQPIHRVTGPVPGMTIGLGQIDKIEHIEVYLPQTAKPVEIIKKIKPNQNLIINIPEINLQRDVKALNPPS